MLQTRVLSVFGGKKVGNLNVELFVSFIADEVYFFNARFSDRDLIPATQQFQVDDVFKDEVDVPHVAAEHGFTNPVVGGVIFFISLKQLLSM